jgi:probable blue pigment (indigoidine) exporter
MLRALPVGLLVVAATRALPRGSWWWRSAVLGTLNIGAFFALLFVSAYRLPGGVAATMGAAQPLVIAALAYVLLAERPTWWRLGWGVIGVVGVGLMVLTAQARLDGIGVVAGLAGTASMAAGIVMTKRWGRPAGVGVLAFTGWQLAAGGVVLLPLALAVEGAPPALDAKAVLGYAWLALVGTLLAYVLWFRGLARLPIGAFSFLPLLSPVMATFLGWALLHQALTPLQGVGFFLALGAIAAAQASPRKSRRTTEDQRFISGRRADSARLLATRPRMGARCE